MQSNKCQRNCCLIWANASLLKRHSTSAHSLSKSLSQVALLMNLSPKIACSATDKLFSSRGFFCSSLLLPSTQRWGENVKGTIRVVKVPPLLEDRLEYCEKASMVELEIDLLFSASFALVKTTTSMRTSSITSSTTSLTGHCNRSPKELGF